MNFFTKGILALLFACSFLTAKADWDLWQSYIIVNSNYLAGPSNADGAGSFAGSYFGAYTTGGSLLINGGEMKTFKNCSNGCSNVCGGDLFYRVYRNCDTPPAFTQVALPYDSELGGGDQKWDETALSVNLVNGLTLPGTYVVEVYWRVWGSQFGGCDYYKFDPDDVGSSSSSYVPGSFVRAYFDFNMFESFSDNNIIANPAWSGDTGAWNVVADSDVAAGTTTGSRTLRLNAPALSQTEYLSTPVTNWQGNQQWGFWMGRRGQAATAANYGSVWLYANEANLESATVDGYRILFGDDSVNDEVHLQVVTNGVGTNILSSSGAVLNGLIDIGFTVYVTRTQNGLWTIFTSTLPSTSGSGLTAASCPISSSTINQGSITHTTYTPSGTGYVGIQSNHSTGANAIIGQEYDNFYFASQPFDTVVSMSSVSASSSETAGSYNLGVTVTNPSTTNATSVNVVLISGDASRVNGFTSQVVNIPANGTSGSLAITITDNAVCDGDESLTFQLQSASGGNNASVGSPSSFVLTIVDDNATVINWLNEDFEDGDIAGWTEIPAGSWSADTGSPASGVYSARTTTQTVAGNNSITYDIDDICFQGLNTSWQFNVKYGVFSGDDPSSNNKFLVFLAANDEDLNSSAVDGYAVGVDPLIAGDPDHIKLWEVVNGVPTNVIVTSTVDWGNNGEFEVGIKVTRDENGLWELFVDLTGDFNNLVSLGTGTNTAIGEMGYFGARLKYTPGLSTAMRLDDVSISQSGCSATYYSQSSGNTTDAIWSTSPVGTPVAVAASRLTSHIIQSGHTVTVSANWSSEDLTINSGGALNAGSYLTKIYGDWLNDGTCTPATSTIRFKGDANQSVSGTGSHNFFNLVIDNNGSTVSLGAPVSTTGVVSVDEGVLNTGGNLTLISNVSGTSSIGTISDLGFVSGNVTLQRYIPANTAPTYGSWINLGCPIPGLTIQDWNDDIVTTGFNGSDFPPPYSFVNVQWYNESIPGVRNIGYVPATDVTNFLHSDNGYFVYLPNPAQLIDITGPIQQGSFNHSLSYTNTGGGLNDGWNLLTNRYPSEVDWDAMSLNGSGVTTYYVWDQNLPGYRSRNSATLSGTASAFIPSCQSFFTFGGSGSFLKYEETYKTNTGQAFERTAEGNSIIAIRVEKDGYGDEAIIGFRDDATTEFNLVTDAFKLDNLVDEFPELGIVSSDEVLATLKSLPLSQDLQIPIWLRLPVAGEFTFLIQDIQNIAPSACLKIEDVVTGDFYDLENGLSIEVSCEEAFEDVRFIIHYSAPATVSTVDVACAGQNSGSAIAQAGGEGPWDYVWKDEMGNQLLAQYDWEGSSVISDLPFGNYMVDISTNCGVRTETFTIQDGVISLPFIEFETASCQGENGKVEINLAGSEQYTYTITNESGDVYVTDVATGATDVMDIPAGEYTLTMENGCGSWSQVIDINDPEAVVSVIVAQSLELQIIDGQPVQTVLTAEIENGQVDQWVMNGELYGNAGSLELNFTEAGEYTIVLHASNGFCSSSDEVIIVVEEVVGIAETTQSTVSFANLNGAVGISVNGNDVNDLRLRVFNALGQVIEDSRLGSGNGYYEVSTLGWSSSAYTMQLMSGDRVIASHKIVN